MITFAIAAVAGAIGGTVVALSVQRWGWSRFADREVIVHVIDSNSIRGVLRRRRGPILELRPAWAISGTALRPLDGGAAIHTDRIDWVQPNPGPLRALEPAAVADPEPAVAEVG